MDFRDRRLQEERPYLHQTRRHAQLRSRLISTFSTTTWSPECQKMLTVGAILSSPTIVNGTIYVGSTDGNVYALI